MKPRFHQVQIGYNEKIASTSLRSVKKLQETKKNEKKFLKSFKLCQRQNGVLYDLRNNESVALYASKQKA